MTALEAMLVWLFQQKSRATKEAVPLDADI